jgi:hypothetical protein
MTKIIFTFLQLFLATAPKSKRTQRARTHTHAYIYIYITLLLPPGVNPIAVNYIDHIYIVRVIKSRRMRGAGHGARMGERRGVFRILVGKPERK